VLFHLSGSHVDGGQEPYSGGCVDQGAGTMSPRGKGHEDPEPASVPVLNEPVLVVRRPSVPDRG
jgi:hypothetical protein